MAFANSTHARHWILPATSLHAAQSAEAAVLRAAIRLLFRATESQSQSQSQSRSQSQTQSQSKQAELSPLGVWFPDKVRATAAVLLLRFFRQPDAGGAPVFGQASGGAAAAAAADSDEGSEGGRFVRAGYISPWTAVWPCLYLAGKADEHYLGAPDLGRRAHDFLERERDFIGMRPDVVVPSALQIADDCVEIELALLDRLQFHLCIFHPFRPLLGIRDQWDKREREQLGSTLISGQKPAHPNGDGDDESMDAVASSRLNELFATARRRVWESYGTARLPLSIAPPLLAWAALHMSCSGDMDALATLSAIITDHGGSLDAVAGVSAQLQSELAESASASNEEASFAALHQFFTLV